MVATLGNSVASARMLLAAGANPNIPSRKGCYPLHVAAELLDSGLLETLLESSLVNLDCRNIKGRTPIILATKAHRLKQFRLLVDAGADRTLSDTDGRTVLHHAARCRQLEFLDILLKDDSVAIEAQDKVVSSPNISVESLHTPLTDWPS
eukprot:m.472940 g.472940  ORF g.472940 m.472940 type:complete len:150 (-) comp57116_c0_seq23:349-798(-)